MAVKDTMWPIVGLMGRGVTVVESQVIFRELARATHRSQRPTVRSKRNLELLGDWGTKRMDEEESGNDKGKACVLSEVHQYTTNSSEGECVIRYWSGYVTSV